MGIKAPTETDLVAQVLAYLKLHRIFAWRNSVGAVSGEYQGKPRFVRFGLKGSSDVFAVLPGGRFLVVETKSLRGKLTLEQQWFLDAVRGAGGLAFCVKSLAELEQALRWEGIVP